MITARKRGWRFFKVTDAVIPDLIRDPGRRFLSVEVAALDPGSEAGVTDCCGGGFFLTR